jgi:hypothetical protein
MGQISIGQIFIAAMFALMLTTAVYSSLGIDTQHVKAAKIKMMSPWCGSGCVGETPEPCSGLLNLHL